MGVVALKSAAITTADTPAATNPFLSEAFIRSAVGQKAIASGDSIASTYRLCRVPSNARMENVRIACAATASALADIGLYKTAADGGAVVDADFFIAAQALTSALTDTSVVGGNVLTAVKYENRLWEALGLSVDPMIYYDITATLTVAATGAGSIAMKATWVI